MSTVNLHEARHNMVEQQVRPWDVLDPRILQLLEAIHREDFVPETYKNLAYADTAIPLGDGEVMMHPVVEGRMLQALDIRPEDEILEIGTGSGFITACLASLGAHVDSIEINQAIATRAAESLVSQGVFNISLSVADATEPAELNKKYDVIAITGSMADIPQAYKQALKPDGRLFVITGTDPVMVAYLVTRTDDNAWASQYLFETSIKALCHAETPATFNF
ncbi:MAG: protein-L-isoaspartate O-methyltransferase [Gammaproteobacteria bacterium]|nr:protein-L-isoaspartate O-methyltransferase [Gammaproteobacteria bacterium]